MVLRVLAMRTVVVCLWLLWWSTQTPCLCYVVMLAPHICICQTTRQHTRCKPDTPQNYRQGDPSPTFVPPSPHAPHHKLCPPFARLPPDMSPFDLTPQGLATRVGAFKVPIFLPQDAGQEATAWDVRPDHIDFGFGAPVWFQPVRRAGLQNSSQCLTDMGGDGVWVYAALTEGDCGELAAAGGFPGGV